LESGGTVDQETRGWNDPQQKTVSQRKKESSHDYRYFPEPDIPPVDLSRFDFKAIRLSLPELPSAKRIRLTKEYGLTAEQVEVLVFDRPIAEYFENVISELQEEAQGKNLTPESWKRYVDLAINYLISDFKGAMLALGTVEPARTKVTAENFADLVIAIATDKINSRVAKDILKVMFEEGGDPNVIIKEKGLEQISDEASLIPVCQQLILANPGPASEFKAGKEASLMFFVGQAMRKFNGKANPVVLQKVLRELLSK
jgi:aspartyl-tRNA(Asn)/glutamyl-tRNA(Gln) amidotransferase subunit B